MGKIEDTGYKLYYTGEDRHRNWVGIVVDKHLKNSVVTVTRKVDKHLNRTIYVKTKVISSLITVIRNFSYLQM